MSDYRSSGIQNHRLVNRETCPPSAVQSSAIDRGKQTTAEPRLWGDPTHAFLTAHRWKPNFRSAYLTEAIKKLNKIKITISTASIRQSHHDLGIFVDWMFQQRQRRTVADEKQEWDCQGDTMKLSRP